MKFYWGALVLLNIFSAGLFAATDSFIGLFFLVPLTTFNLYKLYEVTHEQS